MHALRSVRHRRRALVAVAVLGVLALVLSLSAGAAPADRQAAQAQPNGQTTAFKRQLVRDLRRYEQFALRLERSPGIEKAVVRRTGTLPSAGFARARRQVERLTLRQVAVLQQAFDGSSARLPAPPDTLPRVAALAADCDPDPNVAHDWGAILIAKEIAMGFVAAGSSTPAPLNIAFWTAWAAAQGTVEILTYQQITQEACEQNEVNVDLQIAAVTTDRIWNSIQLDLSPRINYVAFFVNDKLEPWLPATDTKLANLATGLENANTKLDTVVGSLGTSTTGTVHFKLDNLAAAVTTVSTKIDNLQNTVVAGQDLDLRLKIEADLSQPDGHAVALFQLPKAQGGHLELVRSIVADTIAKQRAAGQSVGQAASFLGTGDAAVASGAYKSAYDWFGKAYRQAAN